MQIGEKEYDSTAHFERIAREVSWTVADLAVDGFAQRLVDIDRGELVDSHYVEVPTYLNDYFKGRDVAVAAMNMGDWIDWHLVGLTRREMKIRDRNDLR